MYRAYKNQAQFFFIYVREAHPADGWQVSANKRDKVIYNTPRNLRERVKVAGDCVKSLKLSLPCLPDDMNNTVQKMYRGWPARACIVGMDGEIAYLSQSGPRGVEPPQIEHALKNLLGTSKTKEE